ncbi:MAG: PilZ domain-containing protein [Acidobacteriia bacterium]|nr:PilZ domain-containing protein [Terriglobia bacterium]MBV8902067.1 PilZ domain-containing protein [Terriglobia bacterium]
MKRPAEERRGSPRFDIRLTLRYRLSQKGGIEDHWQTGVTRDMSKDGVAFKTRRPLPIGCHIELRIDWPARYADEYPVDLQATGFVVRSDQYRTAVRISSHRFLINDATVPEMSQTA